MLGLSELWKKLFGPAVPEVEEQKLPQHVVVPVQEIIPETRETTITEGSDLLGTGATTWRHFTAEKNAEGLYDIVDNRTVVSKSPGIEIIAAKREVCHRGLTAEQAYIKLQDLDGTAPGKPTEIVRLLKLEDGWQVHVFGTSTSPIESRQANPDMHFSRVWAHLAPKAAGHTKG